jgi:hypothetical protein
LNETNIEAGNDVGRFIQSEMNRRGWSLRDAVAMAAKKNKKPFSYEHLRKIIKGNTDPSAHILEMVAKTFEIEPSVLLNMHHRATITRKYGKDYLDAMDVTPGMYELDSLMKGLLPSQREMVIVQIKALVEGNLASGKTVVIDKPRKRPRKKA